jgi:hypothetical protein
VTFKGVAPWVLRVLPFPRSFAGGNLFFKRAHEGVLFSEVLTSFRSHKSQGDRCAQKGSDSQAVSGLETEEVF